MSDVESTRQSCVTPNEVRNLPCTKGFGEWGEDRGAKEHSARVGDSERSEE